MTSTIEQAIERLETPANWLRQERGEQWKDAVNHYDRTPYEAAAHLRALLAERDRLRTLLNRARKGLEWTVDEDDDIHQNLIEQIRAALTAGEKK